LASAVFQNAAKCWSEITRIQRYATQLNKSSLAISEESVVLIRNT